MTGTRTTSAGLSAANSGTAAPSAVPVTATRRPGARTRSRSSARSTASGSTAAGGVNRSGISTGLVPSVVTRPTSRRRTATNAAGTATRVPGGARSNSSGAIRSAVPTARPPSCPVNGTSSVVHVPGVGVGLHAGAGLPFQPLRVQVEGAAAVGGQRHRPGLRLVHGEQPGHHHLAGPRHGLGDGDGGGRDRRRHRPAGFPGVNDEHRRRRDRRANTATPTTAARNPPRMRAAVSRPMTVYPTSSSSSGRRTSGESDGGRPRG